MERVVIVVVVALVATVVAAVVQRRRPPAEPAETGGYHVPIQLHRVDFDRPDAEWLVVVFTSATCTTCQGMWDKARHLESDAVATSEIEVSAHRDLHQRYRIDAVPTTVVADHDGVVRASFIGPATATDLWAALAELRDPGSVPDACESHLHNT
ncbi:MAG: thioredoxin family protein [Acidimicrobiales bacterium]|nr:thioredoxin family protein [Acidimicrobiales bacterium]